MRIICWKMMFSAMTPMGILPWDRLNTNPAIAACHDFLSVVENLAVFATTGSSIPLPVERAVYMWMYNDAGSGWGHRHAILWYPYNDNSGNRGEKAFWASGGHRAAHTRGRSPRRGTSPRSS